MIAIMWRVLLLNTVQLNKSTSLIEVY